MKYVANLFAISINRDRLSHDSGNGKLGHPPLILYTELTWTVDTALPQGYALDTIDARIIDRVLIPNTFRAAIRRMKIEGTCFIDASWQIAIFVTSITFHRTEILHLAIDLVCRGKPISD